MADEKTINRLRGAQESTEFWTRRKHFLKVFWGTLPTEELNCLSYCYTNVLTFGCSYSSQKMERLNSLVREMVAEIIKEERKLGRAIKKRWSERLEEIGMDKENRTPRDRTKGSPKERVKEEPLSVEVSDTKQPLTMLSRSCTMKEKNQRHSQPTWQQMDSGQLLSPQPAPVFRSVGRGLSWLSLLNTSDLDGLEAARKEMEVKEHHYGSDLKQPYMFDSEGQQINAMMFKDQPGTTPKFEHPPVQLQDLERQLYDIRSDTSKPPDLNLTSQSQPRGTGRGSLMYRPHFELLMKPKPMPVCHGDSVSAQGKKITTPEKLKAVATKVKELKEALDVERVKKHGGMASLQDYTAKNASSTEKNQSTEKINTKDQRCSPDKKEKGQSKEAARGQNQEATRGTRVEKKSISSAINVLKSAKERIRQVASAVVGSRKSEKQRKEVDIPGKYVPGKYEPMQSLCFENSEFVGRSADVLDIDDSSASESDSTESWESVKSDIEEDVNNNTEFSAGPYTSISHARSQIAEEMGGGKGRGTSLKEAGVPTYTDLLRRYYAKSERDKEKHSSSKHVGEHTSRKTETNVYKAVTVEVIREKAVAGSGSLEMIHDPEETTQRKAVDSPMYDVETRRQKIRSYSELIKTRYSGQRLDDSANNNNNNTKGHVSKQCQIKSSSLNEGKLGRDLQCELKSPTYETRNFEIQIGRGKTVRYTKDPRSLLERSELTRGIRSEKLGQQDSTLGICRSRTFVNSNKRSVKKSEVNNNNE